jgi:hypothetical protein
MKLLALILIIIGLTTLCLGGYVEIAFLFIIAVAYKAATGG